MFILQFHHGYRKPESGWPIVGRVRPAATRHRVSRLSLCRSKHRVLEFAPLREPGEIELGATWACILSFLLLVGDGRRLVDVCSSWR